MKRIIIIQARMNSSRLPGKILKDLAGEPMLARQIARLRACRAADGIAVATTAGPDDAPVADLARRVDVPCFRGDEADVLGRICGAARMVGADVVVRLTADCPLIDPGVVDRVIRELTDHADECDYASNVLRRTFPRGLDAEAFFMDVLERMDRLGRSRAAREHVTVYLRQEASSLFLLRSVEDGADNSHHRWTVDDDADLDFVRRLYGEMGLDSAVRTYHDILTFIDAHPDLLWVDTEGKTWDPSKKRR
jgi:spore coat polysaccharide biosynthesis protein SpsF